MVYIPVNCEERLTTYRLLLPVIGLLYVEEQHGSIIAVVLLNPKLASSPVGCRQTFPHRSATFSHYTLLLEVDSG